MSELLQGVIVGVLVLAATAYVVWRLGPASLRRRFRRDDPPAGDGCSSCGSPSRALSSHDPPKP